MMMEVRMHMRGARGDAGDSRRIYLSSHDSSDLVTWVRRRVWCVAQAHGRLFACSMDHDSTVGLALALR